MSPTRIRRGHHIARCRVIGKLASSDVCELPFATGVDSRSESIPLSHKGFSSPLKHQPLLGIQVDVPLLDSSSGLQDPGPPFWMPFHAKGSAFTASQDGLWQPKCTTTGSHVAASLATPGTMKSVGKRTREMVPIVLHQRTQGLSRGDGHLRVLHWPHDMGSR